MFKSTFIYCLNSFCLNVAYIFEYEGRFYVLFWNLSFKSQLRKMMKGTKNLLTNIIEKFTCLKSDVQIIGHKDILFYSLSEGERDHQFIHDQFYSWQNCSSSTRKMSQNNNLENLTYTQVFSIFMWFCIAFHWKHPFVYVYMYICIYMDVYLLNVKE